MPGIGKILALTILYEIHDIARFERVQDFLSYARLVKCEHSSAGKKLGTGGSEDRQRPPEVGLLRGGSALPAQQPSRARSICAGVAGSHGKAKALSILAAKLGRTVYHMLTQRTGLRQGALLRSRAEPAR